MFKGGELKFMYKDIVCGTVDKKRVIIRIEIKPQYIYSIEVYNLIDDTPPHYPEGSSLPEILTLQDDKPVILNMTSLPVTLPSKKLTPKKTNSAQPSLMLIGS